MINKIIKKLILKYFLKECREITKVDVAEEYKLYLLKNPEDSLKLIKTLLTANLVRYFEATDDEMRMMIKGEVNCLKKIKDLSIHAWELNKIDDEDKRLEKWKKFKIN